MLVCSTAWGQERYPSPAPSPVPLRAASGAPLAPAEPQQLAPWPDHALPGVDPAWLSVGPPLTKLMLNSRRGPDVWSRGLMVHSFHRNGGMRYGPSSSW